MTDSTKEGKDEGPSAYLLKGIENPFHQKYTILGALFNTANEEKKVTRNCSWQNIKITATVKKGLLQGKFKTCVKSSFPGCQMLQDPNILIGGGVQKGAVSTSQTLIVR